MTARSLTLFLLVAAAWYGFGVLCARIPPAGALSLVIPVGMFLGVVSYLVWGIVLGMEDRR